MKCNNCNEELRTGALFCHICGYPTVENRKCPECGESVHINNNFCPNCGTTLAAKPETMADHPVVEKETPPSKTGNYQTEAMYHKLINIPVDKKDFDDVATRITLLSTFDSHHEYFLRFQHCIDESIELMNSCKDDYVQYKDKASSTRNKLNRLIRIRKISGNAFLLSFPVYFLSMNTNLEFVSVISSLVMSFAPMVWIVLIFLTKQTSFKKDGKVVAKSYDLVLPQLEEGQKYVFRSFSYIYSFAYDLQNSCNEVLEKLNRQQITILSDNENIFPVFDVNTDYSSFFNTISSKVKETFDTFSGFISEQIETSASFFDIAEGIIPESYINHEDITLLQDIIATNRAESLSELMNTFISDKRAMEEKEALQEQTRYAERQARAAEQQAVMQKEQMEREKNENIQKQFAFNMAQRAYSKASAKENGYLNSGNTAMANSARRDKELAMVEMLKNK